MQTENPVATPIAVFEAGTLLSSLNFVLGFEYGLLKLLPTYVVSRAGKKFDLRPVKCYISIKYEQLISNLVL